MADGASYYHGFGQCRRKADAAGSSCLRNPTSSRIEDSIRTVFRSSSRLVWLLPTCSLYAALNTRTGEIMGQTVPRHTSAAFIEFLGDIVTAHPRRPIHVIVDNLAAHKTKAVDAFLAAHPTVHLHFTPTYASWLNQVELWFGKIERDLLARGIFRSLPDLGSEDSPLHHGVQQASQTDPLDLCRSDASNHY
jgi:transposase